MNLTIGGKEYDLRFGIKFIETLDRLYTQEVDGLEFGVGVEMINSYLGMERVTALVNAIKAGTAHLNSKPSNDDIETFLEELAEKDNDDYDKLFEEFKEAIEQSPFLKRTLKKMKKAQKEAQKKSTKK